MAEKDRNITKIPDIDSPARRARCRKSLRLFCETYNKLAFWMPWCDDHLRAIERIEEAATKGALYSFAMPRGTGKSAICRMAALWAVSYALCRYVFVIGANEKKAVDTLAAVKTWIRFLPLYAADFPEVSIPANKIGGIANRAGGQLCQGKPTMIEWGKQQVVLPTVPPPENWPKSWRLRADGMVPSSGTVLGVSGLTGDGIRGSLLTLTTGEAIRPDLVLLDDPSTDESAASPSQNATREQLVSGAVLGMAGPGKTISAVMPCTVIRPGDMADNLLDRSKHPLWRGERTKLLRSMPADLDAWEPYFEVYKRCAQKEPPDFTESTAYYLEHRAELEAGAEASWPARKLASEVSAVQHAMHLYCRDKRAFWAEYQNDPQPDDVEQQGTLTADQVSRKLNGLPRARVPLFAGRLTAFVDVQASLLYWAVCGWGDDFTGAVLAYGSFPDQHRPYFTLRDAKRTLAQATGVEGVEAQIYRGLTTLADVLLGQSWEREDGAALKVERLLVDAGFMDQTVRAWCRQAGKGDAVLPSFGRYFGARKTPIGEWKKQEGERVGPDWVIRKASGPHLTRHVLFDSNRWKSFLTQRLQVDYPGSGSLTLYGKDPAEHRMVADHLTSEKCTQVSADGRTTGEWSLIPSRDNHLLDCLVGCAVAASTLGVSLPDTRPPAKKERRPRMSMNEMKARANAGRK